MQSPPVPRYPVHPRSKYSPQHHVLKHPQLLSSRNVSDQVSHPYKTTGKIIETNIIHNIYKLQFYSAQYLIFPIPICAQNDRTHYRPKTEKSKFITWFEFLWPVKIHTIIVWVLTPSVLVGRYTSSGVNYWLSIEGNFYQDMRCWTV